MRGREAGSEEAVVEAVVEARARVPAARSVLAAVTGIDGPGKGTIAALLDERLTARGLRVARIGIDGWLNLPHVRFGGRDRARHFYRHALRFEEMLERLVVPLRERRSIRLETDFAEETASAFRRHVYEFEGVDVILLEGIFLLKRELQSHYDLAVWVECSFETALERDRARPGGPPAGGDRARVPEDPLPRAPDPPRAGRSEGRRRPSSFRTIRGWARGSRARDRGGDDGARARAAGLATSPAAAAPARVLFAALWQPPPAWVTAPHSAPFSPHRAR